MEQIEIIKTNKIKNVSEYKLLLHCLLNTHSKIFVKPNLIMLDIVNNKLNILLKNKNNSVLYVIDENNKIVSNNLSNKLNDTINKQVIERLKLIDIAA